MNIVNDTNNTNNDNIGNTREMNSLDYSSSSFDSDFVSVNVNDDIDSGISANDSAGMNSFNDSMNSVNDSVDMNSVNDSTDMNSVNDSVDMNSVNDSTDMNSVNDNIQEESPVIPIVKPKTRKLPLFMIKNETIYKSANKDDEKKPKENSLSNLMVDQPDYPNIQQQTGMRRVNIGGKFKYVSIKDSNSSDKTETSENTSLLTEPTEPKQSAKSRRSREQGDSSEQVSHIRKTTIPPKTRTTQKIEPTQKTEQIEPTQPIEPRQSTRNSRNITHPKRNLPPNYSKQLDMEIKRKVERNISNFKDLRKMTIINSLGDDVEMDTDKCSISELRKIHSRTRQDKYLESIKKVELDRKLTFIDEIKNNNNLTPLQKIISMRNRTYENKVKATIEKSNTIKQ